MDTKLNVQPGCPFCRQNNLLKGEVLASSDNAFCIAPSVSQDAYLIIPNTHTESLSQLSDSWWADFKAVLAKLPMREDYNVSLNYGTQAGQSVKHLHFWVVPRPAGTPASGKGLARLITEANQAA